MAVWTKDSRTGEEKYVCGKSTDDGELCMNYPLKGKPYCRHHYRENVLRGPEHPNFKHGKYSGLLRRDLLYAYVNSLALEDPYTMRDEVGLIDARLAVLVESLDMADGQGLKDQIFELKNWVFDMHRQGQIDGTLVQLNEVLDRLDKIMADADNERKRWSEILDVIDFRRKLVDSEHKREVDSQKMVSEKELMTMISFLLNILKKHIHDQSVFNTIAAEIVEQSDFQSGRLIEVQSG